MKNLIGTLFILSSLILFSCGDDGESPVLTISSPSNGETFELGSKMTITGTATDDVDLVSVRFVGSGFNLDGTLNGSEFQDVTGGDFAVDIDFIDLVVGSYTVDITALDNDGNTAVESLDFELVQ